MPTVLTFAAVIISFGFTFFALPYWIRRTITHNLFGVDANKTGKKKVAELGGVVAVIGGVLGLLWYVATQVFIYDGTDVLLLLAAVASLLLALVLGMIDDMLGWKLGIKQRHKIVFSLLIALPIMAVNAGERMMTLPLVGSVDFGLVYPLIIIPFGIIGAANGFNMLAGMNGLEAGMGIIALSTLGSMAWITNSHLGAALAACFVASLLAFLFYNRYPAKVFPGDSLTYVVGACIALVAIIADLEKFAIILFLPYFMELALKARSHFQKESFGKPLADGSLANRYPGWHSLNHVAISFLQRVKGRAHEWEVVLLLWAVELIAALCALWIFSGRFF